MKVTHDIYGSRYIVVSYYEHSKEIWIVTTDNSDFTMFKNVLKVIDTKNPHQNDEG